MWRGESLAGKKMLLVAEQGFGDMIQFCRYGVALASEGADITWLVPQPLQRLLAENLPGRVLIGNRNCAGSGFLAAVAFAAACDAQNQFFRCAICALFARFGRPRSARCQKGQTQDSVLSGPVRHSMSVRMNARWSWSNSRGCGPKFPRNIMRLSPALALDDITSATPVTRLDHLIKDFADTAALLMQLDALVTVDTAVAHLAGALGVKTYLTSVVLPRLALGHFGHDDTVVSIHDAFASAKLWQLGKRHGELVETLK